MKPKSKSELRLEVLKLERAACRWWEFFRRRELLRHIRFHTTR